MQKITKDLFLKFKALHPSVHSISYYYGIYPLTEKLVELWYLEYSTKHVSFNSEKELQEALKQSIATSEGDLGFRLPETFKKVIKHDTPST